jgi:hypothetical protein
MEKHTTALDLQPNDEIKPIIMAYSHGAINNGVNYFYIFIASVLVLTSILLLI